ncbi:hypothetical protein J4Q44_G00392390, partial [Coregonus suidteri]
TPVQEADTHSNSPGAYTSLYWFTSFLSRLKEQQAHQYRDSAMRRSLHPLYILQHYPSSPSSPISSCSDGEHVGVFGGLGAAPGGVWPGSGLCCWSSLALPPPAYLS